MRILQVCTLFRSEVASGAVKAAYSVSRELAKRHEVVVYASNAKSVCAHDSGTMESGALRVRYLRDVGAILTRKMKVHFTPSLFYISKHEIQRFDVIHLHEYRTFQNVVVAHYAKKYGVPYVLQAHGSLPRIMGKQELKQTYDVFFGYRLLREASKVIALTRTEAQQYQNVGVPEEKIVIVPNGINFLEFADLPSKGVFRKKSCIGGGERIVLYLGRINKIKGIDILVRAFANIVKKTDNVRLVIVGPDDGYLGELEALIRSLKVEYKVLILGPMYGRDKLEAYVDADVFILPSRYETFPNVVLEAFACSKPVIASDVESISDIVRRGKTGLLFPAGGVQELTEMISYILTHSEEAGQMGHRARKLVEDDFSIDTVVDSLEVLYEEVSEEKRVGRKHTPKLPEMQ